ncbi:DegT/DnrJ/EryC1/StrS family aminotransferase [Ancylothrix sp. C2]|uniref:DegT/DnrJ/EryC1/StrS family aminotransferase n=1 Tax=Ancylothrix sp. D3o TaxID=2953691 RepID=UPI0021BA5503|nr:DegT/DnrJ/EryC1/StrS family aminotransferase [Ancylothrix sp. D3o]MCT7950253.1 DegT/DnrJ/EryC1/StrS family aminotransferase [Ancylothrix sp. D3o]
MKKIPPLDLAQQYQTISSEVGQAVLELLASGRYIGGPVVAEFERQFAEFVGVSDCVGCNSGTDALYLALRALDIGPGDEVITTSFTFFATAEVISAVGATPVFVDIDPHTYNLDLDAVAAACTPRTKAIMPVHLFGQPVDMTRLMEIAGRYNLGVIEDCAQATGAVWEGRRVGSIGHIGCFSFFPTKNLGACGDGGAVTTNDPAIAARVRVLKEHGQTKRYHYEEIGVNSRLDALQAAILQIKLCHLDSWNSQRRKVQAVYDELLLPVKSVIRPQEIAGGTSVWNQYTIRVQNNADQAMSAGEYRNWLRDRLQDRGVSTMVYYPMPLHLQPVYESLGYLSGALPVCEQLAGEVLSLPMFPELNRDEQTQVVWCLKDCLALPISNFESV